SMYLAIVDSVKQGAHAVLVVRTDQGDQVLDNLTDDIMTVEKTGYIFVAGASRSHPHEVYPVIHDGDRMLLPGEQIATAVEAADKRLYAPLDDSAHAVRLPSQIYGNKL